MSETPATPPTLSGWGLLPVPGREVLSEDLAALSEGAVLSRGLGRAYGDSALPPPGRLDVACTRLGDRLLGFDAETGVVRAEAGLTLAEVNRIFMPRGWFPAVTPGTKYVTLGGMVAADVHGKNHHVNGCFGRHVRALRMRMADGRVLECSPQDEPDLFNATVGGMGLTGHVLEVEFQLDRIPSPWIWAESERIDDIDQFMAGLKRDAAAWPMTMGWIDCLTQGRRMGRGILNRGRWAEPSEAPAAFPREKRKLTVPFLFPSWVLNPLTVWGFNFLYFWAHQPRRRRGVVHPDSFFYPLDAILHWNRIYGRRGFTQYQCVLPDAAGPGAVRRFLDLLTRRGGASFLCVIKDCGPEGPGLLSFPMRGTSIALDIAVRDDTQALVDALNEQVIADGGRVYLAKDAFTRPEHFRRMEPRLDSFLEVRRRWDPDGRILSAQWARLMGEGP